MRSIIVSIFLSFLVIGVDAQDVVWSSEAEQGILLGSAEINTGCENASQNQFVKLLSEEGNSLSFNNIAISEAGEYLLYIYYFHLDSQPLEILVNGSTLGVVQFPAGVWCYQGAASTMNIPVNLMAGTNTLEFRTANNEAAPFLDLFKIVKQRTSPVKIYVSSSEGDDMNDGHTPGQPWKTLEKVSDAILIPGDSILFKSGNTFIGQLKVNGSGSEGNPLVVSSYGSGELPVIDGANAEGGAYLSAVLINNKDNIVLSNIEVMNDRRASRTGITDLESYGILVLNNGNTVMNNIVIRDLTIRDVYAVSTEGQDFNDLRMAGIQFYSMSNTVPGLEKNIANVLVENCYITHIGKFGVWSRHQGGTTAGSNDSISRNMNIVIRNNHFYETGGSGVVLSRSYNCLLEHNTFEYPGSDYDPRMPNRGSGAWFWKCKNVLAQYNESLHVRGPADSYSMHIDFGNENVFFQYNYSEDTEGGFVEILGDNKNSVYRFNVSVNDGIRDIKGNSIWLSGYVGSDKDPIAPDENYIYNNTIYVDGDLTPDISILTKNSYIYNNVFYTSGNAVIGRETSITTVDGGTLTMSNNLHHGNVDMQFRVYDLAPVVGDPLFMNPGGQQINDYRLKQGSAALDAGISFPEPEFPAGGKGIFKDVPKYPDQDIFGNAISVTSQQPHIGAYTGDPVDVSIGKALAGKALKVYRNELSGDIQIEIEATGSEELQIDIFDLSGRIKLRTQQSIVKGKNILTIPASNLPGGIYILTINNGSSLNCEKILLR